MRVNNGISLIWYVICGIWSLIGYKLPSYFILVLILVKNQSTMFFTIFIPYQTYRRICSGANKWFFWKNVKNCPFWRHFCNTNQWTDGFIKCNVCKYRWHNNQRKNEKNCGGNWNCLRHTPICPQFVPFFAHFQGRKIEKSNFFCLIPFSISQAFPLNIKSWSTYIFFQASG